MLSRPSNVWCKSLLCLGGLSLGYWVRDPDLASGHNTTFFLGTIRKMSTYCEETFGIQLRAFEHVAAKYENTYFSAKQVQRHRIRSILTSAFLSCVAMRLSRFVTSQDVIVII